MISVDIENLGIRYGAVQALDNMSLSIGAGEFLVLLGPSGCGKSTLLNAVAGLQDVSAGAIRIGGRDMTDAEPKDRGIAMVFQSYALYPRMSVRGNLEFGLKAAGTPRPEIDRRVQAAAEILQIGALLDRRPSELSGGQRQRVAIGRAIVREASVFLFDEPLSNLDAQLRAELRVEIKRLHKRLGATMIYVTHDQVEALTLADRIAIMRDGQIQQLGTPDEIYARPANAFVARFVGSPAINLLEARLSGAGQVDLAGHAVTVQPGTHWPSGQAATFGIRPEHVVLTGPDAGTIPARIELIEPLGAERLVWLESPAGSICARVPATTAALQAGAAVGLRFPAENSHLFGADTGNRISA